MYEAMSRDVAASKFLIDGFPRNQDNLEGWEREMADKVNLLLVLFFDCTEDVSCPFTLFTYFVDVYLASCFCLLVLLFFCCSYIHLYLPKCDRQ